MARPVLGQAVTPKAERCIYDLAFLLMAQDTWYHYKLCVETL